eukprot:4952776-Amphidinium_carterae.2
MLGLFKFLELVRFECPACAPLRRSQSCDCGSAQTWNTKTTIISVEHNLAGTTMVVGKAQGTLQPLNGKCSRGIDC